MKNMIDIVKLLKKGTINIAGMELYVLNLINLNYITKKRLYIDDKKVYELHGAFR